MIALAVIGGLWLAVAFPVAVVIGRAIQRGGQYIHPDECPGCGCELIDWDLEQAA